MSKLKIAVLISGRGTNLQALLDACKENASYPVEIMAVISNKPDAYGLQRAQEAGVPTFIVNHKEYDGRDAFDAALHDAIITSGAEFVCLAGFMRLITPEFVEKWYGKMVNIHPSLLPAFKGLRPHEQAINAGVKLTGCTVHYVSAEMDSGPIIVQAAVPVYAEDTVAELEVRTLAVEHRCYPLALRLIAEDKIRLVDGRVEVKGNRLAGEYMINPVEG